MFRIHFDEQTSRFIVQVLRYNFLWRTVKGIDFETLLKARDYVGEIGLDRLYQDRSADKYNSFIASVA